MCECLRSRAGGQGDACGEVDAAAAEAGHRGAPLGSPAPPEGGGGDSVPGAADQGELLAYQFYMMAPSYPLARLLPRPPVDSGLQ